MAGVTVETEVGESRPGDPGREPAGLARWLLVVAIVVTVIGIGLPLFGVRVFLATDSLEDYAPWRDARPRLVHATNTILGDTYDTGMPVHVEFRRRLFHGDFPLWTSYTSGGSPLAAIPDGGLLSPLSLPYLIFPPWYAPGAAKLLEMAVALGFSFLFLRRIGLSRAAGILGGLVYMNSGFQVVWTNWPQSHVGALIPALFWAVERAFVHRRPRDAVPIALVVATMFLEGFPAVTAYSLIAAAAYVCVRILSERPVKLRARIAGPAWAGIGVALGIGLAAFQLLPFAFHLKHLNLGYRVFQQHLPRYALETLVIPNVLGSPAARTWFAPTSNYVELQSFLGAAAVILVIAGLVRREGRKHLAPGVTGFVYGGIAITAMLIYVGGPLLHLVQSLPLLGINWIGRLRAVFGFLLSMAAAIGYAAVTKRRAERRPGAEVVIWGAVAVVGVLYVAHVWSVVHANAARSYVLRQSVIPVLAGIVALALVVGSIRSSHWRRWAAFVFPVLVAVESLAFVLPFWPRVPRSEYYPVTSAHSFLLEHLHGDRLAASQITMYPGTTTVYGIRSVTSHTFQTPEWNDLMMAIDPKAFAELGPTHAVLAPTPAVATSPVLDQLNARYFAVDPNVRLFGQQLPRRSAAGTTALRPDRSLRVRIPVSRVRGVSVFVAAVHSEDARRPLLIAEALNARGEVLGRGTRRVPDDFKSGELWIPIADEPETSRLRLGVADSDGMTLNADGDGAPVVAPVAAAADGLRLVFAGPAVIYERAGVLPRVRWASVSRVVRTRGERLALLKAGVPAGTVLLDTPGPGASGRPARVGVTDDAADGMAISVDAGGFGYVVIADALQQGWAASVDGKPAPLVAADHALVAVPTPPGHHEIRLTYRPKGLKPGLVVSALCVALTLGALAIDRRYHRRLRNT